MGGPTAGPTQGILEEEEDQRGENYTPDSQTAFTRQKKVSILNMIGFFPHEINQGG